MTDILILAPGTNPDQYYATGLSLHGAFLALARGKQRVVCAGGFEYPQAKAKFPRAVRFEDLGKTMPQAFKAFCKQYRVSNPVVPRSVTAGAWELIRKHCPGARLASRDEIVFPARARKSAAELRAIRAATKVTEAAIGAVRDELRAARIVKGKAVLRGKPLTSEHLKRVAASVLAAHNYSCPDMIISSGAQTALPHHTGSGVIREGAVIVDIFPRSHEHNYYSDMTRTFVLGTPPKHFAERFAAVLAVHKRVGKELKHGAKNVEAFVKPVFHQHGFLSDEKLGRGYIHSLGHGVGLEIHEEPRLNGALQAGNAITIEPGLYYDYGIRVEDIGVVTRTGFRNFSRLTKNPYL
jgi:Xaa-Pro aminopeptidase